MQAIVFVLMLVFAAPSVWAQELVIHGGVTHQTGKGPDDSYAYSVAYREGLGEHAAWSITYVNEGHLNPHKRDGVALQLWARQNVVGRRLSLGVGLGPYFYSDTHIHNTSTGKTFTDDHAVGGMLSVTAAFYLGGRMFVEARGNWIETVHNISTVQATAGLGFQLEAPAKPGPLTGYADRSTPTTENEVTLLAGQTTFNSIDDRTSIAESIEYRRRLGRHFEWTAGWLDEGHPISRTGPVTQIWAGRSFFDDHLNLAVGFGPYFGFDRRGPNDAAKLVYLASFTAGIRFSSHWALRGTFHRVTTTTDRDTDVFLAGVGYRF